ncbi:cadherin-like beta sandwich domain-containing protein [Cohnella candidum]|uniref:cadherin-like beta sandwich domain-containing protein n=1 Tax=Cohnella candidum TaxID=2674991 RepID=UPI0013DE6A07|nr:cadherin-like beta sandwich domain-containing protein [Cohnella candidum]
MRFRKGLLYGLALLLAALPLINLTANTVHAATSRVAIIKSMSGTVQVKKSGGSKLFKAFAKMSLNEGDVLSTSANSSAVLQFANGTSEDDKMSVASGTTLTFSKLSDKNGTKTKVSMLNGSAWVDVKSISSKSDEFTLETPTAIMGVRGTHLLVNVNPETGATRLTVAAGVVNTKPAGSDESYDVKPGNNALVTKEQEDVGEIIVAPADLDTLMKQNDKSLIEAIVTAAGEIVKENQQKLDQYFEDAGVSNDLSRKKTNVENLLGAIVDNAVKNGLISQDRVNQLVQEAQTQTGVTIDLSKKNIVLSDEEKRLQYEQKKKDDEAKKAADEQRKKDEDERKKLADLNKKIEEERLRREEENKKSDEEKKKKAQEEYEKLLSEAEKQRFVESKKKLDAASTPGNQPVPVSQPSSSVVLSDNAQLQSLRAFGYTDDSSSAAPITVTQSSVDPTEYEASVSNNIQKIVATFVTQESNATVKYHSAVLTSKTTEKLALNAPGDETTFDFVVMAPNGVTTRNYTLTVTRAPSEPTYQISDYLSSFSATDGDNTLTWHSFRDVENIPITRLDTPADSIDLTLNFVSNNYSAALYGWGDSEYREIPADQMRAAPVQTWETSGSKSVTLQEGMNFYFLYVYDNAKEESSDEYEIPVALFIIENGKPVPNIKVGYRPAAQIGPNTYLSTVYGGALGANLYMNFFDSDYTSWASVKTVNGAEVATPYEIPLPLSPAGIHSFDIVTEDIAEVYHDEYNLKVYNGDSSRYSMSFNMAYHYNGADYSISLTHPGGGSYGYSTGSVESSVVSAVYMPVFSTDIGVTAAVYKNGVLQNPASLPLDFGANSFDLVASDSEGWSNYRIIITRPYPEPELTDVRIDSASLSGFVPWNHTYTNNVSTDVEGVALEYTPNGYSGIEWTVWKEGSPDTEVTAGEGGIYFLELQDGDNYYQIKPDDGSDPYWITIHRPSA